jgi:hypothetical protein
MIMQGDGIPLFFHLDEKNRLLNKSPRQPPQTEFFRAYRTSQEIHEIQEAEERQNV